MAMLQTIYFIFLLRCVCIVHTESNSILNILLSIKSYCHTQAMLSSSLSTLTVAPLCLASQFWAAMFQLTALLHPPTCPLTTLPLTLLRQPIITFDFDHLHHHYINPCALLPLVGGFFFLFSVHHLQEHWDFGCKWATAIWRVLVALFSLHRSTYSVTLTSALTSEWMRGRRVEEGRRKKGCWITGRALMEAETLVRD